MRLLHIGNRGPSLPTRVMGIPGSGGAKQILTIQAPISSGVMASLLETAAWQVNMRLSYLRSLYKIDHLQRTRRMSVDGYLLIDFL
jgi:hypothetical protein